MPLIEFLKVAFQFFVNLYGSYQGVVQYSNDNNAAVSYVSLEVITTWSTQGVYTVEDLCAIVVDEDKYPDPIDTVR